MTRNPRMRFAWLLAPILVLQATGELAAAETATAPSIVEIGTEQYVVEKYADVAPQARALVESWREKNRVPGCAAACAIDGELVWAEGFGLANVELNVPATPRTRFRVGSVSKMITVGAVAKLVEDGKLDLDAPVQTYVPSFPKKEYPITTRQLTGHLSGIRHYKITDRGETQHFDDVVSGLSIFKDDPLLHPPGTKRAYSSYAWNLVSAVVQGAAGQPFLEYMQEHIFDPNGLDDISADKRREIIPNRTAFYERSENGELINAREIDISYKWAGGGFLSSVEDLVLYGSLYLPGSDFFKPQTLKLLFTPQTMNDGKPIRNGIGWVVNDKVMGHRAYSHGGSIQGGRAFLMILPEERAVVAIAANYRPRVNLGVWQAIPIAEMFIKAGQ